MDPITAIANLATSIFTRITGNKDQQQQQQFTLELVEALRTKELALGQIEVNKAEADNPNRKWATWREMAGYMVVLCLFWAWVLSPVISFLAAMTGHPVDLKGVIQVDMIDVLYIFLGMLGLDSSSFIAGKLKGRFNGKSM